MIALGCKPDFAALLIDSVLRLGSWLLAFAACGSYRSARGRVCCHVAAAARDREAGMTKWVYGFGDGKAEGGASDRNLLGGKGANLAEMCGLGLPVPPGFTITTEFCNWHYANGRAWPDDLKSQVKAALDEVGRITGRRFGDAAQPLLVSVRSGGRASMPGMMDTVLNLGLNDET